MAGPSFDTLIDIVATERDDDRALNCLAAEALSIIPSRQTMIAILNDELGVMEINHGAGPEAFLVLSGAITVDVGGHDGIVGHVAAIGKPYRSGNVHKEDRYRQIFTSTVSEMSAPVFDQYGRVRAVINLESEHEDAYTEHDEQLAQSIANLVAVVLERRAARAREDALIEIGSALAQANTEEELIDKVMNVARNVLRLQACSLFLRDPATGRFYLRGTSSDLADRIGEIWYEPHEGLTGWVCAEGQSVLLQNPQTDERWRGRVVELPSDQIASFLAVPILSRSGSIGCVRALRRISENRFLDNRFTPNDQVVLEAISHQFATGLINIRTLERIVHSERMAAWGELSARSSHMIGNRVFALKGDVNELGYLLKQEQLGKDSLIELQESLDKNVMRVEEILQEFRDFLTATQIRVEPLDLNALIQQTLDEVFPKIGPFKLDVSLDPNLPQIQGDASKLRRALSELIENSIHHMEKGTVHVRTDAEEVAGRSYAVIEVLDEGPGVPADKKTQIFQPFYTSRVKGMGLGLSIVKGVVDAHGGELAEVGKPGEGARFAIRLPAEARS